VVSAGRVDGEAHSGGALQTGRPYVYQVIANEWDPRIWKGRRRLGFEPTFTRAWGGGQHKAASWR